MLPVDLQAYLALDTFANAENLLVDDPDLSENARLPGLRCRGALVITQLPQSTDFYPNRRA